MRKMVGLGVSAALGVVLVACTTTKARVTEPSKGDTSSAQKALIATSPRLAPDAPATRFTPGPHEPHYAAPLAPLPPLASLPRFQDGSSRCFARPEPERRGPYAIGTGQGPGGGGRLSGGGIQSGGGSSRGAPTTAAPKAKKLDGAAPSKPSAPRRAEAPAEVAASPPALAAAPAAPPAPAPVEAKQAARASEGDQRHALRYDDQPEPAPSIAREPEPDWGAGIYLSNDDTMSLSSAQRVIWAIDHFAPIPSSQVRPHELLNYFSFETRPVAPDHDFSVLANIAPSAENPNVFSLALSVQGRPLTLSTRRNVNLGYVIDRSGSMQAEGRMEYLKRGILRSLRELKQGDIVHLTLFDTGVCDLAQNFVVGRDSMPRLERMIAQIQPLGSTNLNDGLAHGYAAVERAYQASYSNRVILITDAIANTGVTDQNLIATVAKNYDDRRVRLSGVGVGSDFNDSLLDTLTERGKGAYVYLGSEAEVDAVFGSRFVSLIETVANDVHFKLQLPPSLAMQTFYGEEASTVKERVQAVHYFADTAQLFLSDLVARDGRLPARDDILFRAEYQDPETGRARVEEFAFNLGQIAGKAPNLDKATLVSKFARELQEFAALPTPSAYARHLGGWNDPQAAERCQAVRAELGQLGARIASDPEVERVRGLWDRLCSRFAPPAPPPIAPNPPVSRPPSWPAATATAAPPVRNNDYAPKASWPSAR